MKVRPFTLLAVLLLGFSSCCHKNMDEGFTGTTDVDVRFNWAAIDAQPASMRLAVFCSGALPVLIPFSGCDGGSVTLDEGTYSFIGYNSDVESYGTRGRTPEDFEIYAQPTDLSSVAAMFVNTRSIPRAQGTEYQPTVFEPEPLWTSFEPSFTITCSQHSEVTLDMEPATTEYTFTINHVDNLGYVKDMTATLSGMSGSWLPALHGCSDTEVIIPFEMKQTDDGSNSITGTVRTLGHCPGHTDVGTYVHKLVLYAEYRNGSRYYYTFDVSETLHNGITVNPGGEPVSVTLDGLPLPTPLTNGTGLHPHVGEWQEVMVPLDM